jgi:hypothetical protein
VDLTPEKLTWNHALSRRVVGHSQFLHIFLAAIGDVDASQKPAIT